MRDACVRAVSSFAPSKGLQDSLGFWIPRHEFWIPGTRFQIPIVSGIPDSLNSIPYFKAQDSGLRKQKFLGFRNPYSHTWGD